MASTLVAIILDNMRLVPTSFPPMLLLETITSKMKLSILFLLPNDPGESPHSSSGSRQRIGFKDLWGANSFSAQSATSNNTHSFHGAAMT